MDSYGAAGLAILSGAVLLAYYLDMVSENSKCTPSLNGVVLADKLCGGSMLSVGCSKKGAGQWSHCQKEKPLGEREMRLSQRSPNSPGSWSSSWA